METTKEPVVFKKKSLKDIFNATLVLVSVFGLLKNDY
jgi:hypothetical protein